MDCICKQNTYWKGNLVESALIGESKAGARTHILNGLTLTISQDGFTLTNSGGAILRQAKQTDVFAIYDSMDFTCENLRLSMPDFNGNYEDYENQFGFGRVARVEKTKWYLYTETLADDAQETAIGLVRYDAAKTLEIASLYVGERLSRKGKAKYAAEFILSQLKADEFAVVSSVNVSNYREVEGVRISGGKYRHKFEQSRLLFMDAMEENRSVTEILKPAQSYKNEKLFAEDEATQAKEGGGQE